MELNVIKDAINSANKGTIHTIEYTKVETKPIKVQKAGFKKVSTFQVRLSDYEKMSKVKAYRAETGIEANNPATNNEVSTDTYCIFYNTKTGKYKLRVPLNGTKCEVKYYIGNNEVTKDDYKAQWEALGYKYPSPSAPSATGVEFRSLDVANITYFK